MTANMAMPSGSLSALRREFWLEPAASTVEIADAIRKKLNWKAPRTVEGNRSLIQRYKNHAERADDFYRSKEWLKLRYATLRKYGPRCMVCGETPDDGAIIQVDHIKPRSKHPELALDPDNLQVMCKACNLGKLNRDEIDYR